MRIAFRTRCGVPPPLLPGLRPGRPRGRARPGVVEVRAGDAAGVHGGEAVAAGARLAEDGLAVPDGARVGLPGELRRAAATLLAARDHRRRDRDAEPDVDDRYHDSEEPAPAREVGLTSL